MQFSAVLTGILFAAIFTIPQKAPAQAQTRSILEQEKETPRKPQNTEAIPEPPPHPPYLIHELLYQVNEVNRRLQAGVVVQCRCNDDYWRPIYESVNNSVNDSDSDKEWEWWPKQIVKGYGYNMQEAKWDAMQACGPIAVPIEPENPEVGPTENGSKVTAESEDTVGIDMDDDSIIWCQKSKRFIYH